MPLKLQGETGYFSREVIVRGSVFGIRELTDDEVKRALEGQAALEGVQIGPDAIFDATTREIAIGKLGDARGLMDFIVGAGVVHWDLEAECTPANVARLPNLVKQELAQQIMNDTLLLPTQESTFRPGGDGAR